MLQNLELLTRVVGVAIAVVGGLASAPHSVKYLWGGVAEEARHLAARTRAALAKFFPVLRRPAATLNVSGTVMAPSASAEIRIFGRTSADAPLHVQVEALWERSAALNREVGELDRKLRSSIDAVRADLQSTVSELRRETSLLEANLRRVEESILRTDASAVPFILLGVVVLAFAPEIGSLPLPIWVGAISALIAVAFVLWLAQRRRIPRPESNHGR